MFSPWSEGRADASAGLPSTAASSCTASTAQEAHSLKGKITSDAQTREHMSRVTCHCHCHAQRRVTLVAPVVGSCQTWEGNGRMPKSVPLGARGGSMAAGKTPGDSNTCGGSGQAGCNGERAHWRRGAEAAVWSIRLGQRGSATARGGSNARRGRGRSSVGWRRHQRPVSPCARLVAVRT